MDGTGAMLENEQAIEILNEALCVKFHSLASYILESSPYARPADLPIIEAIEQIAAADREQACEIACAIENLDGIAIPGAPDPFVSEIAYLAIGRLAERCLQWKQADAQKSSGRLQAFAEKYPEDQSCMALVKALLSKIAETDANQVALLKSVLESAKPAVEERLPEENSESSESV
jgi:hypothetical protein